MGNAYDYGIGVDQDYAMARDDYRRAYDNSVWPEVTEAAVEELGRLLENGNGGPVDLDRALELYEEACRSSGDDTSLGCSPQDAEIAAWGLGARSTLPQRGPVGRGGGRFPTTQRESQEFGPIRSVGLHVHYGPADLSTVGPRGPNSPHTASFGLLITSASELRYIGSAPIRITARNVENHALLPAEVPEIIQTIGTRLRGAVGENDCRLPLVDRDYYQRGGRCWACPATYETPGALAAMIAGSCAETQTKLAGGYLMGARLSITVYGQSPRYPGSEEDPARATP